MFQCWFLSFLRIRHPLFVWEDSRYRRNKVLLRLHRIRHLGLWSFSRTHLKQKQAEKNIMNWAFIEWIMQCYNVILHPTSDVTVQIEHDSWTDGQKSWLKKCFVWKIHRRKKSELVILLFCLCYSGKFSNFQENLSGSWAKSRVRDLHEASSRVRILG